MVNPTNRWLRKAALGLLVVALSGCAQSVPGGFADLVIVGGRVVTVDESQPEATALAIRDGLILAVGERSEVEPWIGDETQIVDAAGGSVLPGFIEGHGHFLSLGRALDQLDLGSSTSWQEIVEQVALAAATARPGEWIFGRGWHQSKWVESPRPAVEGLPIHDALSAVSPDNPVALTHASGHATFVNAAAMRLAGIDRSTPNPAGGEIVRDDSGEAIGVLRENASQLVDSILPRDFVPQRLRRWVELAAAESLAHGVTSFQDAGSGLEEIEFLRSLAEAGELPLRLWVMVRVPNSVLADSLDRIRVVGAGDNFFTVRAIKRAIDGALGTHGAWLLEPYEDLPSSSGLNTTSIEDLAETARLAAEHDFQLCVHAIGDRGNRETLDVFAKAQAEHPDRDWRWRIEHAQHLDPADVPRFAELGVIASMQGVHCTSDGRWVPERLGEQRSREGAYLWRSLIDQGVLVSNGTDTPVEQLDPLKSFYSSVTRRLDGGGAFYPEQAMSRMEALRSYTLNAAHAAFEEDLKGSLTVGKLADVVILSGDLFSMEDDQILETRVRHTIVAGRVVYSEGEAVSEAAARP